MPCVRSKSILFCPKRADQVDARGADVPIDETSRGGTRSKDEARPPSPREQVAATAGVILMSDARPHICTLS